MKNDFEYEFEFMVNNHHKHERIKNSNVPSDHEIRMQQLRRKAEAERPKVEFEAVKYCLIGLVMLPVFWCMMWLMIDLMWAYSYAVRGF